MMATRPAIPVVGASPQAPAGEPASGKKNGENAPDRVDLSEMIGREE
jgi:hypothetical protein